MSYRSEDDDGGDIVSDTATAARAATTTTTKTARLLGSTSWCGATSITLRPSYGMGMWRAVALLACLTATTQAAVFTEGGAVLNGQDAWNKEAQNGNYDNFDIEKQQDQQMNDELMKYYLQRQNPAAEQMQIPDEAEEEYMAYILQEMEKNQQNDFYNQQFPVPNELPSDSAQKQQNVEQKTDAKKEETQSKSEQKPKQQQQQQQPSDREEAISIDEILRAQQELEQEIEKDAEIQRIQSNEQLEADGFNKDRIFKELEKELKHKEEEAQASPVVAENKETVDNIMPSEGQQVPQKKGQNEFVSFVEPEQQPLKQTLSSQTVDKRRLATSSEYSGSGSKYSSSSLLLLAVGTVMSVGIVGTVAGGAYYIKKRNDTPDDGEYAPYAGTGPGFKKNKGAQGDETLAYKAQLHQYQQAKQKIICGEDAPGMIESDGEDGADEENNFSVYECPGLAPTGDIEVCNPNFAAQP